MHDNEFLINDTLVRGLITTQFPQWGDLPLERIRSSGTVHAIYRLGDHLAVRLRRATQFTAALERETAILPTIGPLLPINIPEVLSPTTPRPIPTSPTRPETRSKT